MSNLLTVDHLQTVFRAGEQEVIPLEDISFYLKPGETIGLVGESGCGKSVTALSIMRLLGKNGHVKSGKVVFNGVNLLELDESQMRNIRGNRISMIFQEPMTSLNPLFTIGNQMEEAIRIHLKMSPRQARAYALEMLNRVKIPRADKVIDEYPYTLSGGMQQRVMIAMALSCKPQLLIADEPTTALDVTIQAQILKLMKELQQDLGMAMILITHDLGVVAQMADRVLVIYAGQVVEESDVFTIFKHPEHPYTQGLMDSIPQISAERKRLHSIRGMVPSLYQTAAGCRFHERCDCSTPACSKQEPLLRETEQGHWSRCRLVNG